MKRKFLFILWAMICCQISVMAQFPINNPINSSASGMSLGRHDRNGNPIDTTAVNSTESVPIGLFSWRIDPRFGYIRPCPVDTLQTGFQNSNDTGGMTGRYNYLGNLGSPRQSRFFFDREEESQFFFTDPYDYSVLKPKDVRFTNTLSPYTNLTYYKSLNSRNSEERFKSYFAVNANKRLGFGFYIDYIYGRGLYSNQSTALFNGGLFSSYRGDRYDMHFIFNNDNLKMAENGGIQDDRYITEPLDMAEGKKQYNSSDIPTRLEKIWNHNTSYHIFLNHRYNVGFQKEVKETVKVNPEDSLSKDTVIVHQVFVPVTRFIHTAEVDFNRRKYISQDHAQNEKFFEHNYLGTDSLDNTKRTSIKNTLGISLLEGFNKWAPAGLTAFATHEYRSFSLVNSLETSKPNTFTDYNENVISVGGELSKQKGNWIHYNALGEVAVAGEDAGQYRIEGNADLNIPLWKDTLHIEANAYIKNLNPIFYYRHFHSKHYWWDNDDMSKILRTRIEGKISYDKFGFTLRAGVENIKNYTFLANTSSAVTNEAGELTGYKNNAAVRQYDGNIQVFSALWQQKFKLGIFHLDGEIAYQKSSKQDILPLPDLTMYGNLYLKAGLAKKVLQVELGADVRYFTKYTAPDYSPAIGQFYLQNAEDRVSIGGYPIVNVYANLHLKRTRIFVMMYHINEGSGSSRYFLSPHYPVNPKMFKLGLSWNFFD